MAGGLAARLTWLPNPRGRVLSLGARAKGSATCTSLFRLLIPRSGDDRRGRAVGPGEASVVARKQPTATENSGSGGDGRDCTRAVGGRIAQRPELLELGELFVEAQVDTPFLVVLLADKRLLNLNAFVVFVEAALQ